MGDDLVEQQERCNARHLREQPGVRQHQPDEQRFLLAGRGIGGRDALGLIDNGEIAQVRTVERAAGGRVAGRLSRSTVR